MPQESVIYGTVIDKHAKILALNDFNNIESISAGINNKIRIDQKVYFVCGIWWSIESPIQAIKIFYKILKNRLKYPRIRILVMANTRKENRILKLLGINSFFCNQNCFIDENIFKILPDTKKTYKAIYNATLKAFKRHLLLKTTSNVALLTYNFQNVDYKDSVDKALTGHIWLNYTNGKPTFLNNEEVNLAYNQSRVGLALSAIEGAMYASCEYLLAGIPVVSTKSKGGREVFFNEMNSIIVEDSEKSISEGINELIKKNISSTTIRVDILEQIQAHRSFFIKNIDEILKLEGYTHSIKDTWDEWYINKLRHEYTMEELISKLI
ncbi:hypothetical protein GCM10027578_05950 [Spirosoma luteolum]